MTLYQYCDLKFQNVSFDLQKNFSIKKEGQTKALLFILNSQRIFFKWISVPMFICLYFITKLGLLSLPPNRLEELKKASGKASPEETKAENANPKPAATVDTPNGQILPK